MLTHMPTSRAGVAALHQRLADEVAELPEIAGWRNLALCRAVDANVFFPERRAGSAAWPAKLICSGCSVRQACRDEAVPDPLISGIWAGLTVDDRKHIRAEQRWAASHAIDGAA